MPVSWDDLLNTFEFVSFGEPGEHQAVLCRKSGEFIWHSEISDEFDEWPDDIETVMSRASFADARPGGYLRRGVRRARRVERLAVTAKRKPTSQASALTPAEEPLRDCEIVVSVRLMRRAR